MALPTAYTQDIAIRLGQFVPAELGGCAKRPFGGTEHVLHYRAGYTHRVAIPNPRLLAFADDQVTFRWKDYAHGRHVPPCKTGDGFDSIASNCGKGEAELCRNGWPKIRSGGSDQL